jgi:hypothetical protein
MDPDPEVFAAVFGQLGTISAVIGGFAFAATSELVGSGPDLRGRPAGVTAGLAAASAASVIICALGWSFASVQATGLEATGQPVPAATLLLHARLSLLFIFGLLLLFGSLGVSGWIRSRQLGMVTTVIAIVSGVAALLVVQLFMV